MPEELLYELVPGIYAEEFLRNPRKALQELSGISLGGMNRLFPTQVDWNKCIELGHAAGVQDPAKASIFTLSTENERQLWEDLNHKTFVCRKGGTIQPLRHPERLRYAHLDLASTGEAGVAICHLADPSPACTESGQLRGHRLVVEYDFILNVVGGKNQPIALAKIESFLSWLKEKCGFRFGLVTADMFQSTLLLQNLEAAGITTKNLSVDRDKGSYLALRDAVQEHTLRLYQQDKLLTEAAQLIELERKVDHPPGGSKDVADAVAGAHFNAIMSEQGRQLLSSVPSAVVGVHPMNSAQAGDNPFGNMVPAYKRKPKEHHL